MKTAIIAALVALSPTMASAENDTRLVQYKNLNQKIESLEKAIRLQTLTTEALRRDNYDLACKAQKEATLATHEANVKDVNRQSDQQFAEICVISRHNAEPKVPTWLKTKHGFEPIGIYVERKN